MELLMMAMAYKNGRWNRKKQRVAKTMGKKKKMTDGKHSSKISGVNYKKWARKIKLSLETGYCKAGTCYRTHIEYNNYPYV